jgi:hypothetical protein
MPETTAEITVRNLCIDLERGTEKVPLAPIVRGLEAEITDAALSKAIRAILSIAAERLPVEMTFESAVFMPTGADVTVTAGPNRYLRAKAKADIGIAAETSDQIVVSIRDIRAMGRLPIESFTAPLIDKALAKASRFAGVTRVPGETNALAIEPNVLLAAYGVPARFDPAGQWTVRTDAGALTARFDSSSK